MTKGHWPCLLRSIQSARLVPSAEAPHSSRGVQKGPWRSFTTEFACLVERVTVHRRRLGPLSRSLRLASHWRSLGLLVSLKCSSIQDRRPYCLWGATARWECLALLP